MYFVFDTETTGFPKKRSHFSLIENYDSSRIVSISWVLLDLDFQILESYYSIVYPKDFRITEQSTQIHGITAMRANCYGTPIEHILLNLEKTIEKAQYIIAHNLSFDKPILLSEVHRKGMHDLVELIERKTEFCTMKEGKAQMGIKKFPKLAELYTHYFKREMRDAHSALFDTINCADCFVEIKKSKDAAAVSDGDESN